MKRLTFAVLGVLLLITAVLELALGSVSIGPLDALGALFGGGTEFERIIVGELRLPRLLLALVVGGGLAVSGAVMQGLLRNPLAEPGIVGTSAGAGLGAVLVFWSGFAATVAVAVPLGAFIGAVICTFLAVLVAQHGGRMTTASLLLAGIAVGALALAAMSLMLMNTNVHALRDMMSWLLGGLDGRGMNDVALAVPVVLAGSIVMLPFARSLDIMQLGEDTALSLGLRTTRTRVILLTLASVVTGASVAVTGIIGFVGLMVPHLLRLIVGPKHSVLLPASFLGGAVLLTISDILARAIVPSAEIRLGVVTAFLGAPFFLFLLRRAVREGKMA
jgi:iron complex transport system permease protein